MQNCKLERAALVLLFVLTVWFFVLAVQAPAPIGESDDYMLTTVALQNHGTLQITYEDMQRAMTDFPEHAWYFESSWEKGMPALFSLDGENVYPWYMGTYSLSCIPLKLCLQALGISQSYAFPLTNAAFAAAALWLCWFCLRASALRKILLIAALGVSPIWWYIRWPSAEVFIFSMVTICLIFYSNKNYHLAGFFVSLAGTMNIAVMAIGFFMIADYIKSTYLMYVRKGEKNVFKVIWQHRKSVILLILCYMPSLITPIFNLANFGIINLQSMLGFGTTDGYIARVLTYLFDLNIGFLPYFLIAFPAFVVFLVINIVRNQERWLSFIYAGAFFGTVLLYAVTYHINCGMEGIPRYSAWTFPIFMFYLFLHGTVSSGFIKTMGVLGAIASVVLTMSVVAPRTDSLEQTWVAQTVLNYLPQMYNPYPATFIARTAKLPGGYVSFQEDVPKELTTYNNQLPIIYCDPKGRVRKILAVSNTDTDLMEFLEGSPEAMCNLQGAIKTATQNEKLYYISVTDEIKIKDQYLAERFAYAYGSWIREGVVPLTRFSVSGNGQITVSEVSVPPDGYMYGPYLKIKKGSYTVTITGSGLDEVSIDVLANTKEMIKANVLEHNANQIRYSFKVEKTKPVVELRVFNNGQNAVRISQVYVECTP